MTRVYGLFRIIYAASQDKLLVSRILNHLVLEVVIKYKTKGFPLSIRDKI